LVLVKMYWQRANGLALTSSLRAFVVKSHASRFDSQAAQRNWKTTIYVGRSAMRRSVGSVLTAAVAAGA